MAGESYDVAIIGTGAGGGTLAYALAATGKKILILERGGFLPREKENWDPAAVVSHARYQTKEMWLNQEDESFGPHNHYWVGGNTKMYGAVLFRLRRQDFGEIRHSGGLSPAWPLRYEDMAPWYTKAERLYSVHGTRGVDPTDPPGDPYEQPAVSHEPRIQEIVDDIAATGLHPFPLPVGIRLDEGHPERSQCIRCDTCDGFPCLVNAKADAHTTCVMPALQHANVTLRTQALVTRLVTGAGGRRVTRIEAEVNGAPESFLADIVVVSCGAVNSAALLLRSAGDRHPNGLANASGLVGRNYMCHLNSAVVSVGHKPNPTRFQKTFGINDFYFRGPGFEYPMGHIQMLGKMRKEMLAEGAPFFAPGAALDYMANHSIDWWLTSEDLPDPENRVTLTRDGKIRLSYTPNNEEGHRRLTEQLQSIVHTIKADFYLLPKHGYLSARIPLAGVAHQVGTARFGTDPRTSVLDLNCKAHDLDNLYVVDGSFFCSSAAVNPALTIIANALRVGEHLASRLAG
jgi:choline dehydrogenase-like flavoprotein